MLKKYMSVLLLWLVVISMVQTNGMQVQADSPSSGPSPNLLVNPGFENGSAGWNSYDGAAVLTPNSTNFNTGSSGLKISGRTADWSTASQNITNVLNAYGPGRYQVSVMAKAASGTAAPFIDIELHDSARHDFSTVRTTINDQGFVKVEGVLNVTWTGTLNKAHIFLDTGFTGSEFLGDLYIDDFSLINLDRTEPANTNIDSGNLALGAMATASSTQNYPNYSPANIVNGNEDTSSWNHWAADVSQGPQWVQIDFGRTVSFNRIEMLLMEPYTQKSYEVQYWDGQQWKTGFPKVSNNTSARITHVFDTITATKIRVYVTEGTVLQDGQNGTENVARIVQVEVFNDKNLALNADVTASSTQNYPNYSPQNIVDGNDDTSSWNHWAADVSQGPQWVEIHFGKQETFRRVEFYTMSGYEQTEYEIQYWNGTEWMNCFPKVTGNTSDHNSHSFDAVTSDKLRVYVTTGNVKQHGQDGAENVARINEIKVFSTSGVYIEPAFPDPIPQSVGERQSKTAVGAIRWDGWGAEDPADKGWGVGLITEKTLSPEKYHYRLPWYASVTGLDSAQIPAYTQEIVDKEIEYARKEGIDYWAFVMYEPSSKIDKGRNLYLSSQHKDDIKWAAILGASQYGLDNYPWLVSQFKTSNYQKVLNGRPLVYDRSNDKTIVDALRAEAKKQGVAEPYIVMMDVSAKVMKLVQGDALSAYTLGGSNGQPYSRVAANDLNIWQNWADQGAQVVPIVTAGWDPRPRIDTPTPWAVYGPDQWAQQPTPHELAAHIKDAVDWNNTHIDSSIPNAVLVYAWNENDEGGWLIPTLGENGQPDTSRLGAIEDVLRPVPPTIVITSPQSKTYQDSEVLTPQVQVKDNESGVDNGKTVITLDGQLVEAGAAIPLYSITLGTHEMKVTAADLAGNTAVSSVSFQIVTSSDSLKNLLTLFADKGWITNKGILNSLQKKLEQGSLNAFINEVSAQKGKHIDCAAADILLRDARQLLLR